MSKTIKVNGLLGKKTEFKLDLIKDKYGFLPTSIWYITKSMALRDLVNDSADFRDRDGRHMGMGKGILPLSEFNPDVAYRCYQIWSQPGDRVLDPFMNRGTTSIVAAKYGRIAYACELVDDYYNHVKKQVMDLYMGGKEWAQNIYLANGDARNIVEISNTTWGIDSFDYILTSPPYWNLEPYKSVKGQMSDIETYEQFLEDYLSIIKQCYTLLKPGKFITFVVGDFRKESKLTWFSGHTVEKFVEAGFALHDVVINKLNSPFIAGVARDINNYKRCSKVHEYILTFKKEG